MCQTTAARYRPAIAAGALILSLCCPLAAGVAYAQAPAERPKRLALLVGVNEYKHDMLPSLKYAVNDVTELGQVLAAAGYEVTLLSDDAGKKDGKFAPT